MAEHRRDGVALGAKGADMSRALCSELFERAARSRWIAASLLASAMLAAALLTTASALADMGPGAARAPTLHSGERCVECYSERPADCMEGPAYVRGTGYGYTIVCNVPAEGGLGSVDAVGWSAFAFLLVGLSWWTWRARRGRLRASGDARDR